MVVKKQIAACTSATKEEYLKQVDELIQMTETSSVNELSRGQTVTLTAVMKGVAAETEYRRTG